jgi:hypothetical protein
VRAPDLSTAGRGPLSRTFVRFVTGAPSRVPARASVSLGSRRRPRLGVVRETGPVRSHPVDAATHRVVTGRHPAVVTGLEPGSRSAPHASPTAGGRTAGRSSRCSDTARFRSPADRVQSGFRNRPGRVTSLPSTRVTETVEIGYEWRVARDSTEFSARARNVREGDLRAVPRTSGGAERSQRLGRTEARCCAVAVVVPRASTSSGVVAVAVCRAVAEIEAVSTATRPAHHPSRVTRRNRPTAQRLLGSSEILRVGRVNS